MNVQVKVRRFFDKYDYGLYQGKKQLMVNPIDIWATQAAATRNAKAMAKRIGIPFDKEVIRQHGC